MRAPLTRASLALVFVVVRLVSPLAAAAHDLKAITEEINGDDRRWDWFSSLKQPGTPFPCCNFLDCHQTEAKQLVDHSWTAIIRDYNGMRWVAIPPGRVVKRPLSIDGDAYICY